MATTTSGSAGGKAQLQHYLRDLSTRGIGEWRRYHNELAPVLPKLAPWGKRFGYPEE